MSEIATGSVVTGIEEMPGSDHDNESDIVKLPTLEGTETLIEVNINPDLPEEKKQQLYGLVEQFSIIFTDRHGSTSVMKHVIHLTQDGPVREKQYPLSYATREAVEREVQDMLAQGIIERPSSKYSAPVVLVRKPDGSYRFCVNYKKLHKVTKFDCEPMNIHEDILAKIEGKKYFSKLDFSRGYWLVEMDDSSKHTTAFTSSSDCYCQFSCHL
ncbi:hypothetical protein Pcinc_017329 [Petrolisthes cinctipes]|uniref:Reverse transcriptase domain-containing protein n=1 Tax=Petrolisthes cinctipes TaxID=88211 RepID=A0AAE1FQW6_PETCI|nr:hypothetical protein Pcinc_017329 [Petrolisthes cinctipes]